MKLVKTYKGHQIKELTEMDGKRGIAQRFEVGSFVVFNRDGEEEYCVDSMKEAFEKIDGLESDNEIVKLLNKFEGKYFRARVRERGSKQFKTMDATGYTGMNKFKSDLRGNGYMVSIVVEITNPMEMCKEAFEHGSCIRF